MLQSWDKENKPGTYTKRNYPPCIGCDVAGIHATPARKAGKDYSEFKKIPHEPCFLVKHWEDGSFLKVPFHVDDSITCSKGAKMFL